MSFSATVDMEWKETTEVQNVMYDRDEYKVTSSALNPNSLNPIQR